MEIVVQIMFTIIGVVLSAFLGKLISQNGKILKRMEEGFRMMGEKMGEGFKRMDEGFKKMDEGFKELGQRMDEGFRLIALLILAETPEEKKELARRILREKG
jgi:hypothetical protein